MPINPKILSEDEWIDTYQPLPNPVDDTCGYDFGDGCTLVETYGDHLQYLDTIDPERIWSVTENDEDENQTIQSGRHPINAIGYIVTTHPWSEELLVNLDRGID